jgi:ankyrin repeat protein
MLAIRVSFFKILMLLSIVFPYGRIVAQEDEIDTSAFLIPLDQSYLDYYLMIAASNGSDSEIEWLINYGADIDAESMEGATPLIFAVANNRLSSVKILLTHNPDINRITSNYETPLLIAVKNQNVEIAEALVRGGADVDMADRYGATPLHYASIYGGFYVTDLLLYYEADCNKKALDGTTPLMAAIWSGYADIADLLIQNGANMEARDKEGFTPFLIASQNGDTLLMNLLLKKGIDIYEKNNYNYNALTLAIESNQKIAVDFLLNKGDKWASSLEETVNPYSVALVYRRKEMISILEKNNIPGKPNPKVDQIALSASARFNGRDFFTGASLSLKESYFNGGIIAGCDVKLWYTRVLFKNSEDIFYQYMDKRSVVYAGLFKDFSLTDNQFSSNFAFSTSLSAAYSFGNKLKGTSLTPENKFMVVPAISLKLTKNNFIFTGGIEYMNSKYYHISPLWFRAVCSYNLFLSKVKAPGKKIKWY